jgi:hypothetical protein
MNETTNILDLYTDADLTDLIAEQMDYIKMLAGGSPSRAKAHLATIREYQAEQVVRAASKTQDADGAATGLIVTCKCKICKTNAEHLNLPLPLTAVTADPKAQKLAEKPGGKHFLVYAAHGTNCVDQAEAARYAVTAVR